MTNERLMERLRKVLALTTSPSEGEAAAASAMLAQLLEAHNLSIADLEKRGATKPGVRESGHDLGKAAFKWKLDLAEELASHYYCHGLVNRKEKTVAFVGRPDNVESLQMLYGWVIDQVKRVSKSAREDHFAETGEHIDPLRWQVGFGVGAVSRIGERLRELRRKQASEAGTALVLSHKAEVSDYLEREYGYRIDGRSTRKEQEAEARWAKYREEQAARDAILAQLKLTNIEEYYRHCPWERPEEKARREKEAAKRAKQWERNARRRVGRAYLPPSDEELRRRRQTGVAKDSGYANADKVNLQPFLKGDAPAAAKITEERRRLK